MSAAVTGGTGTYAHRASDSLAAYLGFTNDAEQPFTLQLGGIVATRGTGLGCLIQLRACVQMVWSTPRSATVLSWFNGLYIELAMHVLDVSLP